MPKIFKPLLIATSMFFISPTFAAVKPPIDADKKLVLDYLQNVMAAKNPDIVGDYMIENIIQHGPRAKDGLAGMKKYLKSQGGKTPMKIEPFRIIKQDDLLVVQTNLFNSNRDQHYMHMFRVKDGKIIEYWEAEASINPKKPNQFEGPSDIIDLAKTEDNRLLVIDFINDVFVENNPDKVVNYVAPDMIQHDVRKTAGAAGIVEYMNKQNKRKIGFEYITIREVIGEGNFVMVQGEGKLFKSRYASYDIYRVENNKIAEHWNVIEKIPNKMRHENGAF